MASAEREPITGVWGRSPRWGIKGGGEVSWSWMAFCFCVSQGSCKFAPLLIFAKVSKSHSEWMSHCLTTHLQRMLSRLPYPLTWIQTSLTRCSVVFIARHNTDARYWYNKSVRLSVCPSVRPSVGYVPVSDENGLTYRHSFFTIRYSPISLVLPASNIFTKFRRRHPLRGR